MIGRMLGHYRITEKIGAGGMGEVYRAHDEHLKRDVAIKVLPEGLLADDAARRRFRKEAEALSKLNHPNIQTVHDFDRQDGVDFLVTEYVPGVTLSDRLAGKALREKEVLRLGLQLAEGLTAAHEQGIVHRDLKPSNLRVTPDGRLKILDFGVARLVRPPSETAATRSLTESYTVAGTPLYMAPEQKLGEPVDARTDIYASGLLLHEMATGRPPGEGARARAPLDLQRLIDKCLEKDPDNRYQSAKELAVDLRRLGAPPEVSPRRKPRGSGARVLRWGGVGAAAVALLLAVLLGLNIGGLRDRLLATSQQQEIASLVALPSKVLAAEEDAFLADAIPNTISTHLAQIEGLETKVPPASVELVRFAGDLGKIADAYKVDAFVLSTVTAQADQLLLNVQLVELPGRRLRWSREYQGTRHDYVGLVRRAAEDLRQELRPVALPVAAGAGVSANSEAELAFQRGLYYSNRFNNLHRPEDFEQALPAFQQALELDPQLADAAAEIAWLYDFKLEAGDPPQEVIPPMNAWARRALEIDPENGRAWALLTLLEGWQGQASFRKLLVNGLRAANSAPRFPKSHIALQFGLQSCRLTLEAARQAARLDPLYLYAPLASAWCLISLNQIDEALSEVDKALTVEPDMPVGLFVKSMILVRAGRLEEAASLLEQIEPMAADGLLNPAWFAGVRDLSLVSHGEPGEAEAALQRLLQVASGETPFLGRGGFLEKAIKTLASQGRVEAAAQLLLAQYRLGELPPYDTVRLDPDMQWALRDPQFEEIVQRSRAQFEETVSILEEARARGELPAYLEQPLADLLTDLGMASP